MLRSYFEAGTARPLIEVPASSVVIDGDTAYVPASQIKRLAELEAALVQIDQALVGSYGEIETMRESDVRRILRVVANAVHPSAPKP